MPIKEWERHYSILSESERENPLNSLLEICTRNTLYEYRKELLEFLSSAMGGGRFEDDTPSVKSNRIWFYETLLSLLEVSYRVSELIIKNELTYRYKES